MVISNLRGVFFLGGGDLWEGTHIAINEQLPDFDIVSKNCFGILKTGASVKFNKNVKP